MPKPSNAGFPPPPQTPDEEAGTCVFVSYPDSKYCFIDNHGTLHEFDDFDTAFATALLCLSTETK